MTNLLAVPIIVPMLAAAATLVLRKHPRAEAVIGVTATGIVLIAAIAILAKAWDGTILTTEIGGWAAPFGIVLVADALSAIMVTLTGIVACAVTLYSAADFETVGEGGDAQTPLTLMLVAAVCGAFLTGDLFNLYVWFELLLLSSFVLLTIGGTPQQFEGAVKYVALNLLSSILFLSAAGLIYGSVGTLNMAHLSIRLDEIADPTIATALAAPLLVAFAVKGAVFPFFFWLPASYHTPAPAISALFAGLLTKVGVYALIRTTTLMFDQEWALLGQVILIFASFTMLSGVLGAVSRNEMRRILAFHSVSQIGYMIMGLGIGITAFAAAAEIEPSDLAAAQALRAAGTIGMAGAVVFLVHHGIVKSNLFLISGAVIRVRGTSELPKLGGLQISHPHLGVLFLISSLALAGIPIFSGFWAKLALVRAGLGAGTTVVVTVSLVVSILTLFSMVKIWAYAFWRDVPKQQEEAPRPAGKLVLVSIGGMAALAVAIGVFAGPIFGLAQTSARQILDSTAYINAVAPLRSVAEPQKEPEPDGVDELAAAEESSGGLD